MRKSGYFALSAVLGLMCQATASAALRAYANWDGTGNADVAWSEMSPYNPDMNMTYSATSNPFGNRFASLSLATADKPLMGATGRFGGGMDASDTGTVGKANLRLVHISAPDDYTAVPNDAYGLGNVSAGTIEFFFNPNWALNDNASHSFFFARGNGGYSGAKNRILLQSVSTGGGNYDSVLSYSSNSSVTTTIPFNRLTALNTDWNHIAMVWNTTTLSLYMNGNLIGTGAVAGGLNLFDTSLSPVVEAYWGGRYDSVNAPVAGLPGDGIFDEAALWDEARYSGPTYTVPTSPIPEPMVMGILGIVGIHAVFRRRNRNSEKMVCV